MGTRLAATGDGGDRDVVDDGERGDEPSSASSSAEESIDAPVAASTELSKVAVTSSVVLSKDVLQLRSALSDMAAGDEAKGSVVTCSGSDLPKKGSGGGGMAVVRSSSSGSGSGATSS
jgi:hypothetical protein